MKDVRLLTDELEECYGAISVKILFQSESIRESLLVDAGGVARVYARVVFGDWAADPEIRRVDSAIRQGEAIGRSFAAAGFQISRRESTWCVVETTDWLRAAFHNNALLTFSQTYRLFVAKSDRCEFVEYGSIQEVYSPEWYPSLVRCDLPKLSRSSGSIVREIRSAVEEQVMPHSLPNIVSVLSGEKGEFFFKGN